MSDVTPWSRTCVDPLRFNADGLLPAITQDWLDGAVLMLAWMTATLALGTKKGRSGCPATKLIFVCKPTA